MSKLSFLQLSVQAFSERGKALQNLPYPIHRSKCRFRYCVGFDIDEDAISTCAENVSDLELDSIDLVLCDVTSTIPDMISEKFSGGFDVAIMNPPFGTKNNEGKPGFSGTALRASARDFSLSGIDVRFLQAAVDLGCRTIYSMHKTSTRPVRSPLKLGNSLQKRFCCLSSSCSRKRQSST